MHQSLAVHLLAASDRTAAFEIHPGNVDVVVQTQWQWLQQLPLDFKDRCDRLFAHPLSTSDFFDRLWTLWLPLAGQLMADQNRLDRPLVQGILGGQGTGKTTLSGVLRLILNSLGYPTLSFSLDDLYKTYAERQQLQQLDPRLIWRGPPGTHDVALGLRVLDQLRTATSNETIAIPRFDKSAIKGLGDRTQPECIHPPQIVLFEGWFVGVQPIDPAQFDQAPDPINTAADRQFAKDMNARLQDYQPLWQRLDRLMVLRPIDYRLSQQWRKQAEQQRIAAGGQGMSDQDIEAFVNYFWKALHPALFIPPLLKDPTQVNWVMDINANHRPIRLYQPDSIRPREDER